MSKATQTDSKTRRPNILQRIVRTKRLEIARALRTRPPAQVMAQAHAMPVARDVTAVLRGVRPRGSWWRGRPVPIIAEIKLRSPSAGEFPWHGNLERQVRAYERGGARMISVVTDHSYFGGSLDLMRRVRALTQLPVLQKDFLIDPYQVYLARAEGADACLLIAALLNSIRLRQLITLARSIGLHPLVEISNISEFRRACNAGATLIGVNNRNLRTMQVDPLRTMRLVVNYGPEQICIAESGIQDVETAAKLLRAGADALLIGSALMRSEDPESLLHSLQGNIPAARRAG